jgi:outer membrane protein, multidrug efflux system
MKYLKTILALSTAMLSACNLDPDYQRPDLPVATAWPDGPAYAQDGTDKTAAVATTADALGWHDFFTDERLRALIALALKNNRDLRVAVLNVEAAQAVYRSKHADLFPHIGGTGEGLFEGLPDSTTIPSSSSQSGTTSTSSSSYNTTGSSGGVYRYYTAGIGFTSYELDLFGKVRSESRQDFEQYLGYAETRRSSQISLVSQVATAYLTLLADQELLHITQQTLDSQTASYNLTKMELTGGTSTALALRQAETTVDTAQGNLALYTRQVAQDQNALALLIGQPLPADLPAGRSLEDEGLLAQLPAGLPSDLLASRPDIIAAEHNLLAANANIGAARAAFFPSISLTASEGVASNQLSNLFTSPSLTWSFIPQLTIPIFTAGQNEANLDLAKVQKNIEVADYEKTIQTAFSEVANALAARRTYVDQIKAQQALVDAFADAYRLSDLRFRTGVDNYLAALDSQRSLYGAQQSLVTLKQAELANLVTFYKALGGGWLENTAEQQASLK